MWGQLGMIPNLTIIPIMRENSETGSTQKHVLNVLNKWMVNIKHILKSSKISGPNRALILTHPQDSWIQINMWVCLKIVYP